MIRRSHSPKLSEPVVISKTSYKNFEVSETHLVSAAISAKFARMYVDRVGGRDSVGIIIDNDKAYSYLTRAAESGHCVGAIVYKDELVGFITASVIDDSIYDGRILRQDYFNSTFTGRRAIDALIAAHCFLIEYAKNKGIEYVLSICSPLDDTCQLNRILEKEGWIRKGYTSVYKVKKPWQ